MPAWEAMAKLAPATAQRVTDFARRAAR